MIVNERMTAYIHSLEQPESSICQKIRKKAQQDRVPIVRTETASLLRFFVTLLKPKKILEVGTATGYSAILMSECMPQEGILHTIEKYEPRIPEARANFEEAGRSGQITLFEGDALEILQKLEPSYDLIFMDAAKGQYIHFLPEVERLLRPGGLLISDNVLQDGDVMESRYAVTRRNRTIHSRMREYLYTLKHSSLWTTSLISMGDGITVSVKAQQNNNEENNNKNSYEGRECGERNA
ncbi:MAG: O-methyltransferase [Lachnospiraceae bacterium]